MARGPFLMVGLCTYAERTWKGQVSVRMRQPGLNLAAEKYCLYTGTWLGLHIWFSTIIRTAVQTRRLPYHRLQLFIVESSLQSSLMSYRYGSLQLAAARSDNALVFRKTVLKENKDSYNFLYKPTRYSICIWIQFQFPLLQSFKSQMLPNLNVLNVKEYLTKTQTSPNSIVTNISRQLEIK